MFMATLLSAKQGALRNALAPIIGLSVGSHGLAHKTLWETEFATHESFGLRMMVAAIALGHYLVNACPVTANPPIPVSIALMLLYSGIPTLQSMSNRQLSEFALSKEFRPLVVAMSRYYPEQWVVAKAHHANVKVYEYVTADTPEDAMVDAAAVKIGIPKAYVPPTRDDVRTKAGPLLKKARDENWGGGKVIDAVTALLK